MKPKIHMIWGGHADQASVLSRTLDTRGTQALVCPVVSYKPKWVHVDQMTPAEIASAFVDHLDDSMYKMGHRCVFVRNFADDRAYGGDMKFTDDERAFWAEVAKETIKELRAYAADGNALPDVMCFDHAQFYTRSIEKNKDWFEAIILNYLRQLGIITGIYGGWSGQTYWSLPEDGHTVTPNEYTPLAIPWFIAPGQWRPNNGYVYEAEYLTNLNRALDHGYKTGVWATWVNPGDMDPEDWVALVDSIRKFERGESPGEEPEPGDLSWVRPIQQEGEDFTDFLRRLDEWAQKRKKAEEMDPIEDPIYPGQDDLDITEGEEALIRALRLLRQEEADDE
jgi:hypothetical protein